MNTEFVENMMLLNSLAHQYWDAALCAFRPLSVNSDKTEMELAFHWLPEAREKTWRYQLVPTIEHPYPEKPQGFKLGPREKDDGGVSIYYYPTDQVMPSGTKFKITTPDPVKLPLPSMKLLELKWHLSRIAAMQGAADVDDSDYESDDDSVVVPSGSQSPVKTGSTQVQPLPSRSPEKAIPVTSGFRFPEAESSMCLRSRSPQKTVSAASRSTSLERTPPISVTSGSRFPERGGSMRVRSWPQERVVSAASRSRSLEKTFTPPRSRLPIKTALMQAENIPFRPKAKSLSPSKVMDTSLFTEPEDFETAPEGQREVWEDD